MLYWSKAWHKVGRPHSFPFCAFNNNLCLTVQPVISGCLRTHSFGVTIYLYFLKIMAVISWTVLNSMPCRFNVSISSALLSVPCLHANTDWTISLCHLIFCNLLFKRKLEFILGFLGCCQLMMEEVRYLQFLSRWANEHSAFPQMHHVQDRFGFFVSRFAPNDQKNSRKESLHHNFSAASRSTSSLISSKL